MIEVPAIFQERIHLAYPPHNAPIFEEWFFENYKEEENKSDRIYLPVFWTSFYVNHKYGQDPVSIYALQQFIDKLDTDKKYFTIVQYDDSILNDVSKLDLKVFGMSGKGADYNLPLLCQPHGRIDLPRREIFCSFIGHITHPIRTKMISALSRNKIYYISEKHHDIKTYCRTMANSVFSLCPRGYGATSFRICECLEQGSIPVYISDDFILPHDLDFTEYGVMIAGNEIDNIEKILHSFTIEQITEMQERGKWIYENYFTFESNRKLVMQNL